MDGSTKIGTSFDGAGGNNDGVDYLDQQSICFNAGGDNNIPPIATNVPPGNHLNLTCDTALTNYQIVFLAPENDQAVTLTATTTGTITAAVTPTQYQATLN